VGLPLPSEVKLRSFSELTGLANSMLVVCTTQPWDATDNCAVVTNSRDALS
jgi:hypothetical protein